MFSLSEANKEYISVYEAARRLAITPTYLYDLINKGRVATYKRGVSDRKYVEWHELELQFRMRPARDDDEAQ